MLVRPPNIPAMSPRSSQLRYRQFVEDYRHGRLDEEKPKQGEEKPKPVEEKPKRAERKLSFKLQGRRREYLRQYLRWLRPHRAAPTAVSALALAGAGL